MISLPDHSARQQALDTASSCIVQAPAGAGKTTLLAQRYVALLTQVDVPEQILAITFTIKAAQEMRERVLQLLQSEDSVAEAAVARNEALGWDVLNNPNRLKVQTIDSFALELAKRAPGRYNLSGYRILEQAEQLYQASALELLKDLEADSVTAPLIAEFLSFLENDAASFVRLITIMLAKRDQWLSLVAGVSTYDDQAKLFDSLADSIRSLRSHNINAVEQTLGDRGISLLTRYLGDDWTQHLAPLLTSQGQLRKQMPVDLEPNKDLRREATQWLKSLHERDTAELIASVARLPSVQDLQDNSDRILRCCAVLGLAASALQEQFAAADVTDFTELLICARRALRDENDRPTDLALLLDFQLHHVLIDEFQDTSRGQLDLFQKLTEGWLPDSGNTLFAVGDPLQSIYRFRDADVSIFHEVQRQGLGDLQLENIALTANFRSDPTLVTWVNSKFTENHAEAVQASLPNSVVRVHDHLHREEEVQATVAWVRDLLADEEGTVALLCRSRETLPDYLEAFRQAGINWQATDIDPLHTAPVVSDLICCLQALHQPTDKLAWFSLLRSPLFGYTLAELLTLANSDAMLKLLLEPEHNPNKQRTARFASAWHWAAANLYERSDAEVLEGFWLRCGGADVYNELELEHAERVFALMSSQQVSGPEALRAVIANQFAVNSAEERLKIMTIHRSKGLEFDHVIVPGLERRTRGDDPSLLLWQQHQGGLLLGVRGDPVHDWLRNNDREQNRAEERRLLYVACTRAKRSLRLSFTRTSARTPGGMAKYIAEQAEPDNIQLSVSQDSLFQAKTLRRLPMDYTWQSPAPAELPEASLTSVNSPIITDEITLGNIVHRALSYLAQHAQSEMSHQQFDHLLRHWGYANARVADQAYEHISTTLASEDGQWLLSPHSGHEHESAYQVQEQGDVATIILDRMFVVDGQRWIIDYKTSPVEELERQMSVHKGQLDRYASVMAELYPEPIRKALFFTKTALLQEIP